jgi:hypothetical protein
LVDIMTLEEVTKVHYNIFAFDNSNIPS